MIHTPHVDWFAISTVLVLLGASFIALLGAVLVPAAWRRTFAVAVAALGSLGGIVTSVWLYVDSANGHRVIADSFYRDRWTALTQVILCAITLATVLVGADRVREHESEFFALLLASAAGMTFFVGSANLMVMFLSLEWFSIALYVLCAIDFDLEGSLEAGLKYLVVGSFGSAALLFGSALVYGATNRIGFAEIAQQVGLHGLSGDLLLVLGLAMILAGLAFKSSSAPFHMWTPDVYQGAPTTVTAFMSSATKVAAFALTFRVLRTAFPQEAHLWTWALAGIAVASLVIGNLAALVQTDVKRLLAYSSISHAGSHPHRRGHRHRARRPRRSCTTSFPARRWRSACIRDSLAALRARARHGGDAREPRRLRLGAAVPRGRAVVLRLRLRRAAARRRLRREVLRCPSAAGVRPRLDVARHRRSARDARQPLLPPSASSARSTCAGRRLAVATGGSPPREALLHVAVGAALVVSAGSLVAVGPLITTQGVDHA